MSQTDRQRERGTAGQRRQVVSLLQNLPTDARECDSVRWGVGFVAGIVMRIVAIVIVMLAATATAHTAEINAFISTAIKAATDELLPPAGAAWATVLAASSARLSAAGDDTSGLGAPLRTAIPMPVRARSVRGATSLPRLMSSSIAALSVRNTSTGSPRSKRGISAPEGA